MATFKEKLNPEWRSLFIGLFIINIFLFIKMSWVLLFILAIILAVLGYIFFDLTVPVALLLAFLGSVVSMENKVVSFKDIIRFSIPYRYNANDISEVLTYRKGVPFRIKEIKIEYKYIYREPGSMKSKITVVPVVNMKWKKNQAVFFWLACYNRDFDKCRDKWGNPGEKLLRTGSLTRETGLNHLFKGAEEHFGLNNFEDSMYISVDDKFLSLKKIIFLLSLNFSFISLFFSLRFINTGSAEK